MLSLCLCLAGFGLAQAAPVNTLTDDERAAGWKLLFDGRSTDGWRSYGQPDFPKQGWVVEDGWLKKQGGVRGGDIMTVQDFGDFDFEWEWKIAPNGNNGIKYFILQERKSAVGHEYQMLDDHGQKPNKGGTASFYEVLSPTTSEPRRPAGEINHSRVLVRGNHVEHWLNGVQVLSYTLGSPEVLAGVSRSKFKNVDGFGTKVRGHILLTDHGSGCWFRNIKIKAQ